MRPPSVVSKASVPSEIACGRRDVRRLTLVATASDSGIAIPEDGSVHPCFYGTFSLEIEQRLMGAPRLSVCIPSWNAAPWLEETLASLLAQDGCDLEIVVCDDASTDATLEIAAGFDDARIRIVRNEVRLGLAGNWNRALAQARGELVSLFGHDDLAYPGWASTLCSLLERHSEIDLAFGRREFLFYDEESRALMGPFLGTEYPKVVGPFYERVNEVIPPDVMCEEAMRFDFEVNLIGEPSFVVVRREHPAVVAGFDPCLRQLIDWEFYTRFFVDRPIAHTSQVLGAYRVHASGQSYANQGEASHYGDYSRLLELVRHRFRDALDWRERLRIGRRLRKARAILARNQRWGSAERESAGC